MNNCPHCGMIHPFLCPLVKAIEYFPDGKIKRLEFKTASDYAQSALKAWEPGQPGLPWGPATSKASCQ